MNRRTLTVVLFAAAAGLVACDEQDVSGPGFVCDVANPVADLFLSPSSRVVLVHSPALAGDTVKLLAVTTNRFGGVRTDVSIKFTSSDTTIATVDENGVVSARKPGTVKITASSCGESATSQVVVVSSVARVAVIPPADTIVAGDTTFVSAQAFAPDNSLVPNVVFTFSSSSAGVTFSQTSDSSAIVRTSPTSSGTVTITATGEGTTGAGTLLILPRVFLAGTVITNAIDAGDDDACGIISAGQLFCWGLNNLGQVGAPVDSTCYPGAELSQTLGGDTVIVTNKPCALNPVRVVGDLAFATVSAGDSATCGLTLAGKAYCWGQGKHGEIGNGNVAAKPEPSPVGSGLTFTTITSGGGHVCALATGGGAWCWGNDLDGQLGDGRLVHSTTPIPVASGSSAPAVFASISAGFRHTCALTSGGTAFCWGSNDFGQLGAGVVGGLADTPVQVAGGLSFQAISAGGDHTCGITTGGAAYCWGSNVVGQVGNGTVGGFFGSPVPVAGGRVYSRISASAGSALIDPKTLLPFKVAFGHTCALSSGAIFCWGDNQDLQLGRGPVTGSSSPDGTPVQVLGGELPSSVTFVSVTTGVRTGCGVGTDGAAYCWGSNVYGALGNTLQAAFRGQPQKVATPR
ncbi:MAG: Ig-like domain-containing protein [Gemmatimonadales bacterium]